MSAVEREAWLQKRREKVGASEVAAVLGISPYQSPWEVWANKRGILNDWSGNKATKAGNAFENAVLDVAEQELGKLSRQVSIVHDTLPIASTCDAIVDSTKEPVEAKTTGLVGPVVGNWGQELTDEIPDYYLVQVHAQLLCTGAELAHLYALIAGRGTVHYTIHRSNSISEKIANVVDEWWTRHVINGIEPSRETVPLDVAKRLRRVAMKTVDLDADIEQAIEERELCKQAMSTYKEKLEAAEAKILLAIGDAEAGRLPCGGLVTYYEQSRKDYTVEESKYRVLRVKRAK